jgi:L-threonylcarbamoyladenylate synthase
MHFDQKLISDIKSGAVGVMPSDTIYGIFGTVFLPDVAERITQIKNRDQSKRFVVLIGNRGQLPSLGINLSSKQLEALNEIWPGPVSIVMDCDHTLDHIHYGHEDIAVRLPADTNLRKFLNETGPLIATSANLSGQSTPTNIEEIKTQLPGLDFYIEGPIGDTPSRIARLEKNGQITWLNRSY